MIEVQGINKTFDGKQILFDIDAVFDKGKVNMVLGRSGSGKTVLLKHLVGLFEPDSGIILYDGRNFNQMNYNEKSELRQEIGMVFQGGALFDSQTVEQNVRFPLDMFTRQTPQQKTERVNICLEQVGLSQAHKLFPGQISGGMKKRVAIARAIVLNPKYLFFDEPNSGLDPATSITIDNLIAQITKDYNITTVVNTHDMNSVFEIGDHIVYIHQGKKWWQGNNRSIFNSDNKELNEFVFASNLFSEVKQALANRA